MPGIPPYEGEPAQRDVTSGGAEALDGSVGRCDSDFLSDSLGAPAQGQGSGCCTKRTVRDSRQIKRVSSALCTEPGGPLQTAVSAALPTVSVCSKPAVTVREQPRRSPPLSRAPPVRIPSHSWPPGDGAPSPTARHLRRVGSALALTPCLGHSLGHRGPEEQKPPWAACCLPSPQRGVLGGCSPREGGPRRGPPSAPRLLIVAKAQPVP